jgi:hypothetical protein
MTAAKALRLLTAIMPGKPRGRGRRSSDPVTRPTRVSKVSLCLMKEAWRLRLQLSGFHDLESADDPDGPLSNAGQPSHLDKADTVTVQHAAAYYRRVGQLASKFPFSRDREIAEAVADGASIRDIKSSLGTGQGRIERVMHVLRQWMPEDIWADGEGSDL